MNFQGALPKHVSEEIVQDLQVVFRSVTFALPPKQGLMESGELCNR